MKNSNHWVGIVYLSLSGCLYGIMAPLLRVANSVVPPFTSIVIRYGLVSLALVFVLGIRHELKQVIPHNRRDAKLLILIGVAGTGVANVAFSLSVLTTTIGDALFLFSLYAVFTPILGGMLLREWPNCRQCFFLLIAIVGTGFIIAPRNEGSTMGNLLAICGALLVSVQYVGTRTMRSYSAATIGLYLAVGSIMIALPIAIITEWWHTGLALETGSIIAIRRSAYPVWLGWLALLAFATTNLTVNLMVSQGFRLVRTSLGGILLLLEPLIGLLIGMVFFVESIGPFTFFGAGLVLLAESASIWLEVMRDRQAAKTHANRFYSRNPER